MIRNFGFILYFFALAFFPFEAKAESFRDETLQVHFIDVGYGDAILIKLPTRKTILIDAGGERTGEKTLNYLLNQGITQIDYALITHPHENHFGGYLELLKHISVKHFFTNGDQNPSEGFNRLLEMIHKKKIPVETVKAGKKIIKIPPITFQILYPVDLKGGTNEDSLVTLLSYKDVSFLFTADVGPDEQEWLFKNYPQLHSVKYRQIPHHGGILSPAFLEDCKDDCVFVISTGPNQWGLPNKETLQNFKNIVFRTDKNGSITFETDGNSVKSIYEK